MRIDELERELRAERPEVDPGFASRLDEWAARGFPRGGQLDPRRSPEPGGPRGLLHRLRRRREGRKRPSLLRGPAGATAAATLLVVIIGVATVTQVEPGGDDDSGDAALSTDDGAESAEELGPAGGEQEDSEQAQDFLEQGSDDDFERQQGAVEPASGGARAKQNSGRDTFLSAGPNQRRQAQTISLALATSPEEFREASDGVLDVVDEHNGFVMRSNVSSGDPEVDDAELGEANFELRIPVGRLQPALGSLSDLGHVVSRTDGSRDITARFESARDRIETYTSSRDNLLSQLEEAVTEAEQESIQERLRIVEARLENAREDLARAQQRVRMVPVSVRISADGSVGDGGGWDAGEALDDAGDILRVALGIGLISAAVLLPIALIALIAFLVSRGFARYQRERALDERER